MPSTYQWFYSNLLLWAWLRRQEGALNIFNAYLTPNAFLFFFPWFIRYKMFSSDVLVLLIWFLRFSYGLCKRSYLICFVVLRDDDVCLTFLLTCFFHQLEAMGFDRATVLEVFFACNKNEELAANYLLDHMHEFEDWFNKISMVYFLLAATPNIHSTKKYITSRLFSVTSFLNASSSPSTLQSGVYMMRVWSGQRNV